MAQPTGDSRAANALNWIVAALAALTIIVIVILLLVGGLGGP